MSQTVFMVITNHKKRMRTNECLCGAKIVFYKGQFCCIAELQEIIDKVKRNATG